MAQEGKQLRTIVARWVMGGLGPGTILAMGGLLVRDPAEPQGVARPSGPLPDVAKTTHPV